MICYKQARYYWAKNPGKSDQKYLDLIYQMALVSRSKNDFEQSLDYFMEFKNLISSTIGKEGSTYIECLNGIAMNYMDMEKFGKAEDFLLRAKSLCSNESGLDKQTLANTLYNLYELYHTTGKYDSSLMAIEEVLHIRSSLTGKTNLVYTISLMKKAFLLKEIGNYEKAEACYLEAIDLRDSVYGKEHVYYFGALENLASFYREIGNFEKAIEIYNEVNDARSRKLGKYHPVYAIGLNHLAETYRQLHRIEESLTLFKKVKHIRSLKLPLYQKEFIQSLVDIGALYIELDSLEQAEKYLLSARINCDSFLGRSNLLYASILQKYAMLIQKGGKLNDAEIHLNETLQIIKEILGKEHFKFAACLHQLAILYVEMGNIKDAEQTFKSAIKIRAKILGKKHELYAKSVDQLGGFYENQKKYRKSDPLFEEVSEIDMDRLLQAATFLSEEEIENYIQNFIGRSDKLGSYLLMRVNKNHIPGELTDHVLDNVIFYKSFLLTSAVQLQKFSKLSIEGQELNSRIASFRNNLFREYSSPDPDNSRIEKLKDNLSETEKKLKKLLKKYSLDSERIRWIDVRKKLKKGEAALEFIQFKDYTDSQNISIKYAAILIKPGLKSPLFYPLFDESQLSFLKSGNKPFRSEEISAMYSYVRGVKINLGPRKKTLYELIWKPMENAFSDIKTVYYSSTGVLHRINLNAIAINEEQIISDKIEMIALNSIRQLATETQNINPTTSAYLYGGIYFDQVDTTISIDRESFYQNGNSQQNLVECWDYLPYTEREVDSIYHIMKLAGVEASVLKGAEATELHFRKLGSGLNLSPSVLHLATHGFFYNLNLGRTSSSSRAYKVSEQPMIRSGLIFAGGNNGWHNLEMTNKENDGILTA